MLPPYRQGWAAHVSASGPTSVGKTAVQLVQHLQLTGLHVLTL